MREEICLGKEGGAKASVLSMLLMLRRGCDHPWLASKFWEAQERLLADENVMELPDRKEIGDIVDSVHSAKSEELLKLVKQHPGKSLPVETART